MDRYYLEMAQGDLSVRYRARRGRRHDHINKTPAQSHILIVPVSDRSHELAVGFIFCYKNQETFRSDTVPGGDAGTIIK